MVNTSTGVSALFSALLIFVFTACVFAQVNTGTIEGRVTDQSGSPVAGASVSIENSQDTAGLSKTASTNESGNFVFADILIGNYSIKVKSGQSLEGSWTAAVGPGESTYLDAKLKPVSLGQGSGEVLTVTRWRDEELPRRTTFGSLLKIAPFVRFEPLAAGFQIDGASGSENTFFIDAQETTNYRTGLLNSNNDLPFELLQQVRVKATGFQARESGPLGGTVEAATQGGNDLWRGNLGVSFVPAKFQGEPNTVLNRYGTAPGQIEYFQPRKDEGTAFFPTASVSGPVLKNKLWFFASYSPQIYEIERTIDYFSTGPVPNGRMIRQTIEYKSDVRSEAAYVRLDAQPISNLRIFGSFLYNPIIQDGALPANSEGLSGFPQAAGNLSGAAFLAERGGRQNSNILNGQATWDVTDNFVLNFRVGRGFLNEKLNSYGVPRITRFLCSASGNPLSVPGSGCSNGFQNISNNSVRDYDVSKRTTFDSDTLISGIDAWGSHAIRAGYQFNQIFNNVRDGYTDTGLVVLFYTFPISNLTGQASTPGNLGSGYLQRFGIVGEASSRNQAIFGQDSWHIARRLTLNLGIRFENETVPNYGSTDTDSVEFGWGDKIAPRLGFALDVTGDGKTRIFGSYGRYFDRFKYQLPRNLFGGSFFRRDYFEILPSRGAAYTNYTFNAILGGRPDVLGGTCPIIGGPGFSVCQLDFNVPTNLTAGSAFLAGKIDPDLKPMRQSEITVGVNRELPWDAVLDARFTHKQLERAVETIGVFDNQGSQAFIVGNPGFGLHCEIGNTASVPCAKAERDYDAVEVSVDKRSASYFFNVNYTWSRLVGNYSGLASSDEFGFASPNYTAYFNLPSQGFTANGVSDSGELPTDRPHVFKAYGGYGFDWNGSNRSTISAFTTIQSGTPLTTIYNLYGLPSSILFERGDLGRTETFSETDLLLSHAYRFGADKRWIIEPYAIVLNLFDERNELTRQTSISTTNFTSSSLISGGCTSCSSQALVYNTIFNRGGIRQFVLNFLNARGTSASGVRNDYNLSNAFQDPRYFRFGVRVKF